MRTAVPQRQSNPRERNSTKLVPSGGGERDKPRREERSANLLDRLSKSPLIKAIVAVGFIVGAIFAPAVFIPLGLASLAAWGVSKLLPSIARDKSESKHIATGKGIQKGPEKSAEHARDEHLLETQKGLVRDLRRVNALFRNELQGFAGGKPAARADLENMKNHCAEKGIDLHTIFEKFNRLTKENQKGVLNLAGFIARISERRCAQHLATFRSMRTSGNSPRNSSRSGISMRRRWRRTSMRTTSMQNACCQTMVN